jgi:hypothetical protein
MGALFIAGRRDSSTETALFLEKINNLPVVLSYRGRAVIRIQKILVYSFGSKALKGDTGQRMMAQLLSVVAGVATAANAPAVGIASLPRSLSTSCCCGLCCCCPAP